MNDQELLDIPRTNSHQSAAYLHYCQQMRFNRDREHEAIHEYSLRYPHKPDDVQWKTWAPVGQQKDDLDKLISLRQDVRRQISRASYRYAREWESNIPEFTGRKTRESRLDSL